MQVYGVSVSGERARPLPRDRSAGAVQALNNTSRDELSGGCTGHAPEAKLRN